MKNFKTGLLVSAALCSSFFAAAQWVTNGVNTHHTNTGNVYVGDVPPLFPVANGKLHVKNPTGAVLNTIYSDMNVTANTGFITSSVRATLSAVNTVTGNQYGVYSTATTAAPNSVAGVRSKGFVTNSTQGLAYGVYGEAQSAHCDVASAPIGLYGRVTVPSGCTQGWALYADGRTFTPGGVWTASDARLKTNIQTLGGALDMVKQLQPKTYLFRNDGNYANTALPTGQQYGFMAADLEKVMPAAVTDAPIFTKNGDGEATVSETIRAVNYNMLIPVLTQAIKELEAKVEALEAKLGAGNGATAVKAGRLFQNKPNPAEGNTVIGYELPAGISKAAIVVYNMQGSQVKSWPVSTAVGSVTLGAGELAGGVYLYSLVADGKELDSKRMLLTGK